MWTPKPTASMWFLQDPRATEWQSKDLNPSFHLPMQFSFYTFLPHPHQCVQTEAIFKQKAVLSWSIRENKTKVEKWKKGLMKCATECLGKEKIQASTALKKILWPLYIMLGLTKLYKARFYCKEPGYLGGMGEMILPPASPNVCNNERSYNRGQLYIQWKGNH